MIYGVFYRDPAAAGTNHEYHWGQAEDPLGALALLEANCELPENYQLQPAFGGPEALMEVVAK